MAFRVMADNSQDIMASQDGAMYDVFAGGQDFIIGDIGDEFALTTTSTSLTATVGTGEALISGRHITAQESNSIELTADSTLYIALRIDLTQTQGNEGMLVALTTESALETDNLNAGGSICDLLLYEVTTTTGGVSSYTDRRTTQTSAGGGTVVWTINYAIPETDYVDNTSAEDWAKAYYADVTLTACTVDRLADVNPDTSITTADDYGLLTTTDTMAGVVRCYFSDKPTGTYQILSIILTNAREDSEVQSMQANAAVLSFYEDKLAELAEQKAAALAAAAEAKAQLAAAEAAAKAAEEERLSAIESTLDNTALKVDTLAGLYLSTIETELSDDVVALFETVLQDNAVEAGGEDGDIGGGVVIGGGSVEVGGGEDA